MSQRIDQDVLGGFAGEARSYLPKIRRNLAGLQGGPGDLDALEEAHRLVHSIKGAAAMVGLSALSGMAALLEEAIEQLGAGQLACGPAAMAVFEETIQAIEAHLDSVAGGNLEGGPFLTAVVSSFRRLRNPAGPEPAWPPAWSDAAREALVGAAALAPKPPAWSDVPREALVDPAAFAPPLPAWADVPREAVVNPSAFAPGPPAWSDVRREALVDPAAFAPPLPAWSDAAREALVDPSAFAPPPPAWSDALREALVDPSAFAPPPPAWSDVPREAPVDPAAFAPPPAPWWEAPRAEPMDPAGSDLLDIFRIEAGELLRGIGELLHGVQAVPNSRSTLAEVRRSVHTLKGAAGSVGLDSLRGLAHRMEDLLDAIHEGAVGFSPAVSSLLLATFDCLHDMAEAIPAEVPGQPLRDLYARYEAALSPASTSDAPFVAPTPLEARAAAKPEPRGQYVRVPIERLDEMVRLVSELVVSRSTFEQNLKGYSVEVEELQLAVRRVERIAAQLDGGAEAFGRTGEFRPIAARGGSASSGSLHQEFDALEFDRYTAFHLLERDLRETISDLDTATEEMALRAGDFDNYLVRQARLTSDIQDRFMHMRMVPLATLATRLRRAVRVAAGHAGKMVDLVIEGERVELDKTVIDELAGPLEHLLRNAVDHGIESESVRLALGKPARGRILLRARYEGTQAVIEVSDDGAGLRTRAVGEAAVRAGLCSPDEAARMTPSELHDLIYHQGITTAPEVTSISGRGVGMDAVKATVSRLKGAIQVASEPDRGAVFTIRLPLTLAVMRALLVRSNGETFAIPMAVITQVLRATPEQIEHIGRQPVLRTGGQVLPAVHLGAALQLKHPPDHTVRTAPVLVIDVGGRKLALLVDHLVEAREIVVKKLAGLLGTIRGVTGVTVTGDGAAVLIVNPNDLMAAAEAGGSQPAARAAALPTAALDVLIVDDSVSVRHVLTSFIRKAGLNPITAKDGVEALEVLEHAAKPPDVALLDIEMPRMDGYELTAALRSSAEFRNLPIVMLTSRAGEKHRQKAFRLGASEYLVKPYEEETLLKVIRRVVNEARARAQGSVHATLA